MVTCKEIKVILSKISSVIEKNKLYLSELDAAIGDGDHGLNMNKGFKAVELKIKDFPDDDIGKLLKTVGMTLVSTVGGASGPLYGTAFMKASMAANNKDSINIEDFINILTEALNGIKMRGKAAEGEKTMIDTLSPALEGAKKSLNDGKELKDILVSIKDSARDGMNGTKDIIATKGRASYLKERSIGHQDPGATSMYLILSTIVEEILKVKGE